MEFGSLLTNKVLRQTFLTACWRLPSCNTATRGGTNIPFGGHFDLIADKLHETCICYIHIETFSSKFYKVKKNDYEQLNNN